MPKASEAMLLAIQGHFHELIRARAGTLIEDAGIKLPELPPSLRSGEEKAWLAVPGMYGGFSYWLDDDANQTKLVCESWSRVVEGSGRRHEVTADGSRLVAEGFV